MQPHSGSVPRRNYRKGLLVVLVLFFLAANSGSAHGQQNEIRHTGNQPQNYSIKEVTSYLSLKSKEAKPPVYAKSIVLMDKATGELLWSKNPDEIVPVASTTKMATALVARKLLNIDDIVTIPKSAVLVQGSKINLLSNEKITVHDLLRGLLIQSGNDAAFALADYYGAKHGGDYKKFIEKVNEFLTSEGILDTKFTDPAGLDDDNGYSTARSLAHIARLLLQDSVLAEIVVTPQATVRSVDGGISHDLKNSNRLVLGDSGLYLPGTLGVKTGFTHEAGHCLVSAYRGQVGEYVGVVLNTNEYTITASSSEMRKLFVWADANVLRQNY